MSPRGGFTRGLLYKETRQRRREIGVSINVVHEIALIMNLADKESTDIHVLRRTFAGPAPPNWLYDNEEIHWTLEREPYEEWYGEKLYKLSVFTWMSPLTKWSETNGANRNDPTEANKD